MSSPDTMKELALGAFILPNQPIPDEADLRSFITPGKLPQQVALY
jgi:endonuclease G